MMQAAKTSRRAGVVFVLFLVFLLFVCFPLQQKYNNKIFQITFDSSTSILLAEYAQSRRKKEQGLMHRIIDENDGMLFDMRHTPTPPCFWMKDTLNPLSIAFINDKNIIVQIADMQPLTLNTHRLDPKHSCHIAFALEVNQGWFTRNNITVGTRIQWHHTKFYVYKKLYIKIIYLL